MAGSSLTWDDLWASLCAGFEVRDRNTQHRVSTEGVRAGRCDGSSGLQVMAAQRVARSVAKRSGRQV